MERKDYTELKKKFGEHLQDLRDKKKLSLREVAANCDLDDSNISKIEHGKKNITLATIIELAKGLNIHPSKLMDFEYE